MGFEFKGLGPCGFIWLSFCGLVWLVLCIFSVYLGAPYAFLIKSFLLIKKKKSTLLGEPYINNHSKGKEATWLDRRREHLKKKKPFSRDGEKKVRGLPYMENESNQFSSTCRHFK